MAAPTFLAAGLGGTATTTSTTVTKPVGTVAGKALLALVCNGGANTAPSSVPSGWTLVDSKSISTTFWAGVYLLVAGGSEPANYTWSGFAGDSCAGSMVGVNDADTTTPVHVFGSQANTNSNPACPGITTTVPDCLIVAAVATHDNQLITDVSWACATNPTSLTERTDLLSSGGNDTASAMATAPQTVTGATGNLTATLAGTRDNVSFLIAIQPPQGGATVNQTDTAGLVDVADLVVTRAAVGSDDAGLSDAAALALQVVLDQTDSAGLGDIAALALQRVVAQEDAAGLVDAADLLVTRATAATDSAGLADEVTVAAVRALTIDDAAGLADVISSSVTFALELSDSAGLTDQFATEGSLTPQLDDSAGLTDAATFAVTRALTVDDTAGLTDLATNGVTFVRAFTDEGGLADLMSTAGSLTAQADDPAGLTDTVALAVTRSLTVDDVAGLSDVSALAMTRSVVLDDSAGLADGVELVSDSAGQTFGDSAGLADELVLQLTFELMFADVVGLTDVVSGLPPAGGGVMVARVRRTADMAGGGRAGADMAARSRDGGA